MTEGKILSIERMGLVDGPGIRTVVFLKGCALRCIYCHNPDSWDMSVGETITSCELIKKLVSYKMYYKKSGGGVTFSGGEPLIQKDFLLDCLKKCKKEGISTCIDTAGCGLGLYDEILDYTDYVLFDVKATNSDLYFKICGHTDDESKKFLEVLKKKKTPTIVRQVVIGGITDTDTYMESLKDYIKTYIPHAHKVELLPFHKYGEYKYEKLNISYSLKDTKEMDKEKTRLLEDKHFRIFNEGGVL